MKKAPAPGQVWVKRNEERQIKIMHAPPHAGGQYRVINTSTKRSSYISEKILLRDYKVHE